MSVRNTEHPAPPTFDNSRATAIPSWVSAVVVVGALLTAMGGVIALVDPAMLVSPHDEINGAVHIYAGYLAARNIAVACALTGLLLLRARRALGNLLALVALIQLLDGCMDCVEGRWMVAPGVFALGVIFLLASTRLSGAFWRREAWTR